MGFIRFIFVLLAASIAVAIPFPKELIHSFESYSAWLTLHTQTISTLGSVFFIFVVIALLLFVQRKSI
ncbi:hypothetical protein [Aliivibrio fischeri]|uniref:Uncharacterized protein n=1 Tax=Aliivibrio fischeri (strain MJ11) TaxID=388396 RepID=B5EVV7_ALIFM|nr:hypothetical protein [Aliivibrio fischeri]ACH64671.1 hypothetical protein VFMJ11_B0014 [Aliivibrio fischeri MJ11]